ncbi:MAG: RagB/SusD family nutrient uptake outer membrane protein [Gemmatimonadetes bacterium]|nr:RagB/SusD family nutrient uptake outer membrane protein [Gemmatimonadota bacterium]
MTFIQTSRAMRTKLAAALAGLGLTLAACGEFDAPNQNSGTLDDLAGSPTAVAVNTATQGLFGGIRGANRTLTLGILGREAYSLDVSNPQNTPQFYVTFNQLTGYWGYYGWAKQGDYIIGSLPKVTGITAGEKEGTIGFVQTVKAYLLFAIIRETDVAGAALDETANPLDAPPTIATRAQVYARILSLLDSANTHLSAAGAAFPFAMTTGFAGFSTAATFRQFNRAIRAKVNLTNAQYAAALTDLGGSFLNVANHLSTGAYNTYSNNSGDAQNGLYDPTARQRYAHSSFALNAKLQAGAAPGDTTRRDLRFLNKIYGITKINRYGFTVDWAFKRYASTTDPIPVIKNEDLILMRAEANIANRTATGDAPLNDINLIRTTAGGLPAISGATWAGLTAAQQRDTLLYEKRYSLMYENGDRWVDLRRYGILQRLPQDRAGDLVWPNLRLPDNECVPRTTKPAGCTAQAGLVPGQAPLAP